MQIKTPSLLVNFKLVTSLALLAIVGCGGKSGTVTIPVPLPDLEISVGDDLPGQVIAASQKYTVDGTVTLAEGSYEVDGLPIEIPEETTVKLSGVVIDVAPIGDDAVKIAPADFNIAFTPPVSVATVDLHELTKSTHEEHADVKIGVYNTLKNLIALALMDTASATPQPLSKIVSKAVVNSAAVEMRPDSTIRTAGLDLMLKAGDGVATNVTLKDSEATFSEGKVTESNGTIELNLACSVETGENSKLTFGEGELLASGVADWSGVADKFSAETREPFRLLAKEMSVTEKSLSLALTPVKGKEAFSFAAEGDWADGDYAGDLAIKDASVDVSGTVEGGTLKFQGNADGFAAASKEGQIQAVRTNAEIANVNVAYTKEIDAHIITVESRLPKISVTVEGEVSSLNVSMADLIAASTTISVFKGKDSIATLKCGASKLTAKESVVSGGIESLAIKLKNGAVATLTNAVIDRLSEEGTGTISVALKESALPKELRQELGNASLTAEKLVVQLKNWKPSNIDMLGFKATTAWLWLRIKLGKQLTVVTLLQTPADTFRSTLSV